MDFLVNNLNLFEFPTTLWGIHIDPELKFLGILHVRLIDKKTHIDKSILFYKDEDNKGIKASTYLDQKEIFLAENNCSIDQFSEINELLLKLENVNKCANFENEEYPNCMNFVCGDQVYCENCLINSEVSEEIELVIEYACSHCDSTFKSNRALKAHLKKHKITSRNERNKEITCEICDLTVKSNNINDHMLTHDSNKPFRCKYCDSTFKSNRALKAHLKKHKIISRNERNKEITCEICDLTVKSNNINDHMLTHDSNKPFRCKYCDKTFAKRYNLKMHENIHLGTRPFMCNHCGKSFSAQSNLKSHIMYSHENEKSHVCEVCKKAFIHPRILRIHMRKHTGEKPFVCGFCGKSFAQNVHRKVHMRSHTGEKPYVCNICDKGFITSGNLDWHRKNNHKEIKIEAN